MKKDIVFITSRFPYPLDKGDKLRAFWQIKGLSQHMNVHLISLSEHELSWQDLEALNPYCKSINNFILSKPLRYYRILLDFFSNRPFSVSYFYNSRIKKSIDRILEKISPDYIHCHLIRTALYINPTEASVLSIDYMDCFSLGALKELDTTSSIWRKLFLKSEYRRLRVAERESYQKFDKHFIICKPDREALPLEDHAKVEVLPNGVDFETFYPNNVSKEYDLLFSGHMSYIPNISAAKYAATKILPKLSTSIKLLIAGIGVTNEIAKLKGDNVTIKEDFHHIREAFWKSNILLAPMNISIGLQNKILQSMAMKVPVVCTPQANESINAKAGTEIVVAASPEEFKAAIERLLADQTYHLELSNKAYNYVMAHFDWNVVNDRFVKHLKGK